MTLVEQIADYMGMGVEAAQITAAVRHSGVDDADFSEDPDAVVEEVLAALQDLGLPYPVEDYF